MISRTSTPASAGRSRRPSLRPQAISSPVSSTKTSSRLVGRRSPSWPLAFEDSRSTCRCGACAGPAALRLALDLVQPRRRPVDLDRLGARVLGDQLARRAGGDRLAVRHDRHGVGEPLGLLDVVRRHQDRAPSLRSRSISAHSSWRTCGSRPTVGSSSRISRGWCTSPRAISSRRRMPPQSLSTFVSRRSVRLAISSARSTAALALGARHAVEVREDEQVLLDGERDVEVVELGHDAAQRARRLGLARAPAGRGSRSRPRPGSPAR